MKTLYSTRRPSTLLLLSAVLVLIATATAVLFMFQSKSEPTNNVAGLFTINPMTTKPSITSATIEQPVSDIQVPASPTSDANISAAVAQTAAAQSQTTGSQVAYPSLQITSAQRDRLYVVAISIGIIGSALYTMTLLGVSPRRAAVARRPLYKVMDM